MSERTPVLDHGYIKTIEHWGSDERIVEAARMSTNKGFQGWGPMECPKCGIAAIGMGRVIINCSRCDGAGTVSGDEKLLAYLYNHKHMTPFEMAGMTIEVQAPIMVFREWHRHRTQSYNEMSARYTPLPDVNYIPSVDRCMIMNAKNKQAGKIPGAEDLTESMAESWCYELNSIYARIEALYQAGLKVGIPKELARLPIPVGRYSRMRASANLRNWLGFLTLRSAPDAQWEIRQFAVAVGKEIAERFPRVWELFNKGA